MKELLLRGRLVGNELDVVDHQDIHRPELVLECHRVLETKGVHEARHELLGRHEETLAFRSLRTDPPGDGIHQMGLAQSDAAVEIQRVVRNPIAVSHVHGSPMGEVIGLTDHEILEREPRIELGRGAGHVPGNPVQAVSGPGTALDGTDFPGLGTALGNTDSNGDVGDLVAFAAPQVTQALATARHDPLLHVVSRHPQHDLGSRHSVEGERSQPRSESRFPKFGPQPRAHTLPLVLDESRAL